MLTARSLHLSAQGIARNREPPDTLVVVQAKRIRPSQPACEQLSTITPPYPLGHPMCSALNFQAICVLVHPSERAGEWRDRFVEGCGRTFGMLVPSAVKHVRERSATCMLWIRCTRHKSHETPLATRRVFIICWQTKLTQIRHYMQQVHNMREWLKIGFLHGNGNLDLAISSNKRIPEYAFELRNAEQLRRTPITVPGHCVLPTFRL